MNLQILDDENLEVLAAQFPWMADAIIEWQETVGEKLREAKERMQQQNDMLRTLTSPPIPYSRVALVTENAVIMNVDGKYVEVTKPGFDVYPGDLVKVSPMGQIVDLVELKTPGSIGTVYRKIDDSFYQVETPGGPAIVSAGRLGVVNDGDKVILDQTNTIIIQNLGQDNQQYRVNAEIDVDWDDVGGQDQAKMDMVESIEWPATHSELYEAYGRKSPKGILLFGPPGCGKTLLAKAAANAMARIHSKKASDTGYIYVKGPEVLDKFVGVAESNIRSLFKRSRLHFKEHGYPAIIFIDEAEALLGRRGSGISSDVDKTIVPTFLAEMDGMEDSGALVLLATNRPDMLDSAVTRDGRVDKKIKINRPNAAAAMDILSIHMSRAHLAKGLKKREVVEMVVKGLFEGDFPLYEIQKSDKTVVRFDFCNVCSGSALANLVDTATDFAIKSDVAAGNKTPTGVTRENFIDAVKSLYEQALVLDHRADIEDFVHDFKNDIVGIHKVRMA